MNHARTRFVFTLALLVLLLAACAGEETAPPATPLPATPTGTAPEDAASAAPQPAMTAIPAADNYKTIAIDAPFPPFSQFDDFGNVVGFDAELAENLMARLGYDYEFVVTKYTGMLESVGNGEFDLALSAITRQEPGAGVLYTEPYLETGQVLVVLANEQTVITYHDIPPGMPVGVVAGSLEAKQAATRIADIPASQLQEYETPGAAVQALIDGQVDGVIMDHDDAEHFTRTHYEQLKIAGGNSSDAWLTHQAYVMAVGEDNSQLLAALNDAIVQAKADGTIERVTRTWLVSKETIDAGESLIGTPGDMIVVGVVGSLNDLDPAAAPDLIGWEVKSNTMSGLYVFTADDELIPMLAAGPPEISEDRLEYTFRLREGLSFPDGSLLTADDVKESVNRAATLGSWHVNNFLKDSNSDGVADADAVQVVDGNTVRFILKQPASFFLHLLATPPYFVISKECYATDPAPARNCNGIGHYEIIEWQEESLQLRANPQWPGEDRARFENVRVRFYQTSEGLRNAVELGAVDVAWVGMAPETVDELLTQGGVRAWEGPATFKSYLVFQQEDTPWQTETMRQAVAYAVDREQLAALFGGRRQPLYTPVPASDPFATDVEPQQNIERAQDLLRLSGYSIDNPLVITLSHLNDGRYTPLEAEYAGLLKSQLEATGMIVVELQSASWGVYSQQMSDCEYSAFLLGWPPVGWPTRYPATLGWLDYFVTNTDSLCSNYRSPEMDALIAQARRADPVDDAAQEAIYTQIQELWAQELPTLDLTQATPRLIATETIDGVRFDRMGLLHYETLTKMPQEP